MQASKKDNWMSKKGDKICIAMSSLGTLVIIP
jgi:hypothetical protein